MFLNPEVIDHTLQRIRRSKADAVLHYVEESSFDPVNWPTQRTYIPIGGKNYTGTTIYYIRKVRPIFRQIDKLVELRAQRKNPQELLHILGCKKENMQAIAEGLSNKLGMDVEVLVSPHPELGVDVDKPADYELALRKLPERFSVDSLSEEEM